MMPYVSVVASVPVDGAMMDGLQKEIGRIIALIPGKTIDNCMTRIEGDARIFMGGGPAKAVFCDVRLYGVAPEAAKVAVSRELHGLFTERLGAEKVYINYLESEEWGSRYLR